MKSVRLKRHEHYLSICEVSHKNRDIDSRLIPFSFEDIDGLLGLYSDFKFTECAKLIVAYVKQKGLSGIVIDEESHPYLYAALFDIGARVLLVSFETKINGFYLEE